MSLARRVLLRATWLDDAWRAPRSRLPTRLAATIEWDTGDTEELTFQFPHHGAWRDAYVCAPRQLVLKIHLAPGVVWKAKGSNANREEYDLALNHPALPKPEVYGCFDIWVDGYECQVL